MNRQGDGAGAPDWWSELYDDAQPDSGRTSAGDTIDERFSSAARTVGVAGVIRPGRPEARQERDGAEPPEDEPPQDVVPVDPPPVDPPPVDVVPVDAVPPPRRSGSAPGRGRGAERGADRTPAPVTGPAVLPAADPDRLDALTPDTVLDGAHHGPLTVRAVSTRGDWGRHRGRPRYDALLTARFGSGDSALLLLALATGAPEPAHGHLAAREACAQIAGAIGRSQPRLAEDLRRERRSALKSGLGRLTARSLGRLRASAVEQGLDPTQYTADLRCLVLPADPYCRVRLFFGVGDGGLFRLRSGEWQDLEPGLAAGRPPMVLPAGAGQPGHADTLPAAELALTPLDGDLLSPQDRLPPSTPPFLFRTSMAEPGDALLLCSHGMAEPLRTQGAFGEQLGARWGAEQPPGLAEFLTDTQLPAKGHADDRTAVGVWEPPAEAVQPD